MNLPSLPTDNFSKFWSVALLFGIIFLIIYNIEQSNNFIKNLYRVETENNVLRKEIQLLKNITNENSLDSIIKRYHNEINSEAKNFQIKLNETELDYFRRVLYSQFVFSVFAIGCMLFLFYKNYQSWARDQKKINAQQDLEFKIKKLELEKIEHEVGRLK